MNRKKQIVIGLFVFMWIIGRADEAPISARLISPQEGELWIGPLQISLIVDQAAEKSRLGTVEFYLDGRLIKESKAPPYSFAYDFGQSPKNHKLKAIIRDQNKKVVTIREIASSQFDDNVLVKVTNIILPVVVLNDRGLYASDLQKDNFEIIEEGAPQEITYFSKSGSTGLHLVMLIDISSSMKNKMGVVKKAAGDFLNYLISTQDKVKLVYFNHDILEDIPFTNDKTEIANSLDLAFPFGATALYDAIANSVAYLQGMQTRRTVIVFSDGLDNCSLIDPYNLLKKVEKSNTKIYSINTFSLSTSHSSEELNYQDTFAKITSITGGKPFFIDSVEKMSEVYDEINKEMKSEYILQISPEKQMNRFRNIQIRLRNKRGLTIRGPQGYYY